MFFSVSRRRGVLYLPGLRTCPRQTNTHHGEATTKISAKKAPGPVSVDGIGCFPSHLFSLYYCLCLCFLKLFFAHFAQILGAIQAIQEKDTIKVIYFVLENTRKPALSTNTHGLATRILALYDYLCCSANIIAYITRDT